VISLRSWECTFWSSYAVSTAAVGKILIVSNSNCISLLKLVKNGDMPIVSCLVELYANAAIGNSGS
jgi:hypothetical protein